MKELMEIKNYNPVLYDITELLLELREGAAGLWPLLIFQMSLEMQIVLLMDSH